MANSTRKIRTSRLAWTIDTTAQTLLCVARNPAKDDELIPGFSVRIDAKKLSPENALFAKLFGLKQTIGDEAAQSQGATLKQKFDAMQERAAHLESGSANWTTGRGPSESSLLFRAVSEVYPKLTPVQVQEWIGKQKANAKAKEMTWVTYQAKLLQSDTLRETVDRLRAEEAQGTEIDTEELFAELDSEE